MNAISGLPGAENGCERGSIGRLSRRVEVKADSALKGWGFEYAGNDTFVPCEFLAGSFCATKRSSDEAKFAMRALGAEALGEFELLAGFSGSGEIA